MSGSKQDKTPAPLPAPEQFQAELARFRADQERLFQRLQASEQHFKRLARSVWRVQEDERRRMARDLHDGIGQNLTALKHRLDQLSAAVALQEPQASQMAQAIELCTAALAEARALARALRPQILDDLGLGPALHWLARSIEGQHECRIELDVDKLPARLDGDLETLVFRVVQEALANALKHAAARHLLVRAGQRGPVLQVLVLDDGKGCDARVALAAGREGHSSGLAGMRERVRLFGGQFQFQSQPDEGTQIRITVPLEAGQAP